MRNFKAKRGIMRRNRQLCPIKKRTEQYMREKAKQMKMVRVYDDITRIQSGFCQYYDY